MSSSISREFHFGSLLRFALPTIVMMIFMSLYTIVDGFFVAHFLGTSALSSINIVWPLLNVVVAVAIMLSAGGSAIVARKMGEGNLPEARRDFTLIALAALCAGIVIAVLGFVFLEPIIRFFGAEGALLPFCRDYLGTLILFAPINILQMFFQFFFITAGRPHIGLALTVGSGVVNAVLDYILIVPAGLGIRGAALATAAGFTVPAVFGLIYFLSKRNELHFTRPKMDRHVLVQACFNGSSEMVVNLSNGVTTLLFNLILLRLAGADGVAAITIIMYVQFLFLGLFQGFSDGIAPVVSYNYGSRNTAQLRRIFKIAIGFLGVSSIVLVGLAELAHVPLISIFAPAGSAAHVLARSGFVLYAINFVFAGFNIFCSALFTALGNGRVSAIISFLRTFVFLVSGLLLLPYLAGVTGVWLAVPIAELLTLFFSAAFFLWGRREYRYA